MKVQVIPGQFLSRLIKFLSNSFRRVFSNKKTTSIYLLLMVIAAIMFTGIVSDVLTRSYRIVFSGGVFGLCLICSIVYGIPAAAPTMIVNLIGASFTLKLFNGTEDWYYLAVAVFQLTTAISSIIIAVLADVEKSKKEIHKEASLTDALTEIYNTRFFHLRLDEELTRAVRRSDPLTLMYIDVNDFKSINDNFGHAEGDKVLKDIAAHLLKSTRATDVVCRSGGDEFAVILPDTSRDTGVMIANRISSGTPEYVKASSKNGVTISVHLAVGVATYPADADNRADLIEFADMALYRDKKEYYAGRTAVEENR